MYLKILQWNLNGYNNNLHELQLLIKSHSPDIIALQETHLHSDNIKLGNYSHKVFNTFSTGYAKGGVALLIKNSIEHTFLPQQSNLCSVGALITSECSFHIFSIYISPTQTIPIDDIADLINNSSFPVILLGDFNAHSTIWGSQSTNQRGKVIENLIISSNIS